MLLLYGLYLKINLLQFLSISWTTQLLIFVIALKSIEFALFKLNRMNLKIYLIVLIIEAVLVAISAALIVLMNKFKENKNATDYCSGETASIISNIIGGVLTLIFIIIRSKDNSLEEIFICILLNITVTAITSVVVMLYYKAYLIKKYKIDINLIELFKNEEDF